jgi:hypothetical protein
MKHLHVMQFTTTCKCMEWQTSTPISNPESRRVHPRTLRPELFPTVYFTHSQAGCGENTLSQRFPSFPLSKPRPRMSSQLFHPSPTYYTLPEWMSTPTVEIDSSILKDYFKFRGNDCRITSYSPLLLSQTQWNISPLLVQLLLETDTLSLTQATFSSLTLRKEQMWPNFYHPMRSSRAEVLFIDQRVCHRQRILTWTERRCKI